MMTTRDPVMDLQVIRATRILTAKRIPEPNHSAYNDAIEANVAMLEDIRLQVNPARWLERYLLGARFMAGHYRRLARQEQPKEAYRAYAEQKHIAYGVIWAVLEDLFWGFIHEKMPDFYE